MTDRLDVLEPFLRNLLANAQRSLIEDDLDDGARGYRTGVIDVCEAVLRAA